MNQQPRSKGAISTNVGYGIGYGLLLCFIAGAIIGYFQHDFERWIGIAVPVGVGFGVIGGMIADRLNKGKAS